MKFLSLLAVAVLLIPSIPTMADGGSYRVFVHSNGWHTGIAVAVEDIPDGMIPEAEDFSDARYLEFGWGDAEYFPKPDAGVLDAIGAAFPGPAVVHVTPLQGRPREVYRQGEEVILMFEQDNFSTLIEYLHESFDRGGSTRAEVAAPGLLPRSKFYPATGEFSLANTCNTWTARGLAAAGVDIRVAGVQRAEDVMEQLRETRMRDDQSSAGSAR